MAGDRALWEALCIPEKTTVFQDFHWNLLAFTMFAGREEPHVVCARASYGVAIVPAVICRRDSSLRMLGEELFDYRNVLHHGDTEVLRCALASLAPLNRPLVVVALRDRDRLPPLDKLDLGAFSAAPTGLCTESSPHAFAPRHGRRGPHLGRLPPFGF